jgi:glutaredoxin
MAITLYHLQGCPYCRKVREYVERQGMKPTVQYRETSQDPEARARVEELTGATKVPVLEVDGEPIVGSDVIIQWLAAQADWIHSLSQGRSRPAA